MTFESEMNNEICQVQKEEILFGQKKLGNFFDVLPKTTLLKGKKSIGKIRDWICQNSLLPANCLLWKQRERERGCWYLKHRNVLTHCCFLARRLSLKADHSNGTFNSRSLLDKVSVASISRGVKIEISLQITFRDVMVVKHGRGAANGGSRARSPLKRTLRFVRRTPVGRHDHVPLLERRGGEPYPVGCRREARVRTTRRRSSDEDVFGQRVRRRRVRRGPVWRRCSSRPGRVWRVGDVSEWRSHRRSRRQWKLEGLRPFHLWWNSGVRALTRNSAYARGVVVGWRGSVDLQKEDKNSSSEFWNYLKTFPWGSV